VCVPDHGMKKGAPGAQDEKWPRDSCDVGGGMLIPSMVANLFAPNSSLGEKIKGAYMPSWALLGMTAVE
jgi:hypothetical protein